jgi:hypothetical protein
MKFTKLLSPLNERDNNPNLHQIASWILKTFVDMRLIVEISFDQFLSNLQLDEKTYLFALQSTIWKLPLVLKCKPNDIRTNVFNIHVGPLWEANTNA